jgi:hypothetical protein
MRLLLMISAAFEILAGIVFLFFPHLVSQFTGIQELMTVRMYGAAACAIGLLAYLGTRSTIQREQLLILQILTIFQVGVTVALILSYTNGDVIALKPAVLHGILAIWTLFHMVKIRRELSQS